MEGGKSGVIKQQRWSVVISSHFGLVGKGYPLHFDLGTILY
jgi:hypothetical protein